MTIVDYIALTVFALLWTSYNWATDGKVHLKRISLTRLMMDNRRRWLMNSLNRDLKMIDTQIVAGLQAGTAFFASTTIFALGGCFALLGATDQVQAIMGDLPYVFQGGRTAFELKVGGLACLFAYSFFKFAWSYRLFNYCSILVGSIPMMSDLIQDRAGAERAAERAVKMNILAAKNFNAGLRSVFLSIGYLGWFISPYVFIALTIFVIFVLARRQFYSEAREALLDDTNP
ncbi:DUF599 family protein [Rhizobium sp. LjRoot98]|uniref:DUF599 domain-containing protein n=1 Tax=unclassified Rhizobium TaxID=2613769 RepID=UPI0007130ABA|nr:MULTISPECIES: DUF599 family protein [unclassified Rhizobium]KQV30924.1 hypothetical protein ASC96_06880 [Rhizobium sp. Root1204]KQY11068.1 hypothetical protein ASD36_10285 [Rhizobium sp. Root1334]KRC05049.1 hypothetical protein ASE23_08055 [Rhizobium sp. Root73]